MHHLKFLDSGADRALALSTSYSPVLVALSILIAALAAYSAFGIAGRIRAAGRPKGKRLWLAAGSAAMAAGIWAMHFIGMLALRIDAVVSYDLGLTLLSIAPAMAASVTVLCVTGRREMRSGQLVLGGLMMALGIGAMHYTGMAAMHIAAEMRYDPLLFGGSLLVAFGLATAALRLHFVAGRADEQGDPRLRLIAAATLGSAVAAMHYTGMAAAYFFPSTAPGPEGSQLEPHFLAALVAIAAGIVIALTIFVVVVDKRLKAAASSVHTSRARMIEAIESVSEGFCLFDAMDRLVICNRRYRELSGHTDGDVVGMTFEQLLRQAASRGLIPAAKTDTEAWVAQRVHAHRNPSGPQVQERAGGRWLQISERKTEDGGIVAIYTDISELKSAEIGLSRALDDLRATQDHLVQSEKLAALGRLTAGITHEMNTPVGVVNSSADSFGKGLQRILTAIESSHTIDEVRENPQFKRSVLAIQQNSRVIVDASQRIKAIVNNLKAFADFDKGKVETADVNKSVETAMHLVRQTIHDRARIRKILAPVPGVQGNPAELTQVFMTLLTNAVQSVESAEGEVVVSTSSDDQDVHISVKDTGPGIPAEELGRVFDFSFSKMDSRIGVRMGLPTVQSIVHRHGGKVRVVSEAGKGTEFLVQLPVGPCEPTG